MTEEAYERARELHGEIRDLENLGDYLRAIETGKEMLFTISEGYQNIWWHSLVKTQFRGKWPPIMEQLIKEYIEWGRNFIQKRRKELEEEFENL